MRGQRTVQLLLSREQIVMQLTRSEGDQIAIRREVATQSKDILLYAGPHGSAVSTYSAQLIGGTSHYAIDVYANPADALETTNHFKLLDPKGLPTVPLLVMASNEASAVGLVAHGDRGRRARAGMRARRQGAALS